MSKPPGWTSWQPRHLSTSPSCQCLRRGRRPSCWSWRCGGHWPPASQTSAARPKRSSLYQSVWHAWNYITPIGSWFPHHHSKLYHDGSTVPVGSWRHSLCRWIGWHLSRPACRAGWYKAWVPCPAGNTENRWHAAVYIEPHSNRVATEVANFTKKIANFFLGFFADFRFQAWLKKKIKASFIL